MARKPRIEFAGAFYHVIARGNQKQKIFKDPTDFQKCLQILTIYKNRYQCFLYAYVLMGNHVHLLVETRDIPLSKILQGVNQTYTMYFNRKYRTVGHLFQGRYKAILCDRDTYLLSLLKYIHLNPFRAKITETLDGYQWSSHQAYTGKANPLALVDTDLVLRMFSENKTRARRHYRAFMIDGITVKKEEVYATIDQRLLGEEEFVDMVLQKYDGEVRKERKKREYTLPQIAGAIEALHGISPTDLRSSSRTRRVSQERSLFCQIAIECGYRRRELAAYLQKDPAAVTGYLKEEKERLRDKKAVLKRLKEMAN